ncbi:hypothetical protein H9L25_00410 [Terrisporobacter mayombei]|nr:hypothetical protein [Terrisporobacter mayombei]
MKNFQFKDVIIGNPIVEPWYIFCKEQDEWSQIKDDIYYTEERFLPKIMVDLGIVKSVSEVRRNKPQLMCNLDHLDYLEVKWGKNKLFILVGE